MFSTDTLMLSNYQEVYEKLVGASVKWCDLGGALGLDQNTLSAIDLKYHGDTQGCLREMLTKRLHSGGPLSWRVLCDSLRNQTVKCDNLATEIEKEFGEQQVIILTN